MRRVRIKFCGITRAADVRAALDCGADAIGFNCASGPRRIEPAQARALAALVTPPCMAVLLLQDPSEEQALALIRETRASALQLHGQEPRELCARLGARVPVIKACAVASSAALRALHDHPADLLMLDSPGGGSGATWDHRLIESGLGRPWMLAGGLTPGNVGALVRMLRPWGVDVSSGIEDAPGIKDPMRMAAFAQAVRAAT